MDNLNKLEIFVPVEAEVMTVPLNSLPRSVLRRIDLQHPCQDSSGGQPPAHSEVTWICPVVLRRRGRRVVGHSAGGALENLSSVLNSRLGAVQAPLQMSIVSPNRTAYSVLRGGAMEGLVPFSPSRTPPAPAIPSGFTAAVVLYRGNIYLSVKKQTRRRRPGPATPAFPSSSSDVSSMSQRQEVLSDCRTEQQRYSEAGGDQATTEVMAQEEPTQRVAIISDVQEAPGPRGSPNEGSKAKENSRSQVEGPEAATMSSLTEFDFQALAQQERITLMKARLQRNQAALKTL